MVSSKNCNPLALYFDFSSSVQPSNNFYVTIEFLMAIEDVMKTEMILMEKNKFRSIGYLNLMLRDCNFLMILFVIRSDFVFTQFNEKKRTFHLVCIFFFCSCSFARIEILFSLLPTLLLLTSHGWVLYDRGWYNF